jgi:DNA mismatch repair protein MutL
MGYGLQLEKGRLILEAVPSFLGESGIAAFVESLEGLKAPDSPMNEFLAGMACKAAVKDGEVLDDFSARKLIAEALALPFPRCPHGRPIWVRLDGTALARMVGRTIG